MLKVWSLYEPVLAALTAVSASPQLWHSHRHSSEQLTGAGSIPDEWSLLGGRSPVAHLVS
jgi:hypothetical protein